MQVSVLKPANHHSISNHPLCVAASLELKVEKKNAHSGGIFSVDFNNDGTKIASGSADKTIKVWGARAFLAISHHLAPHYFLSLCRCLILGFGG